MKTGKQFAGMFKDRHVLVAGASAGIGLAVAEGLAEAGATLSILAENDMLHEAAKIIGATGNPPQNVLQCDVSDPDCVYRSIGSLPTIDAVIQIAGYQPMTPVRDMDRSVDNTFRRCMDVNVNGAWYVVRAALNKMDRGGKIVLTSSIWGKTAAPEYAAYSASKHAVIGLTRTLAVELGPAGINVNAVCPGWVDTEGAMWTVRQQAEAVGISENDLVDGITDALPMPGMMDPEDMQAIYLFLASDLAKDITGQAYSVDRGSFLG